MDKILSSIKIRIKEYADFKKVSLEKFLQKAGVSYSNFKGKALESEIGGEMLAKILAVYSDLNSDWVLSGEGQMIREVNKLTIPDSNAMVIGQIQVPGDESPYVDLGNGQFLMIVPLIPIRASAGYREHYNDEKYVSEHYDKHYFPVTRQYRGKYFAFVVDGDSMDDGTSGGIIEGSTVTGREIQKIHWKNKFHLKSFQDYVIVHKDAILVKRITEHDTEKGTITCHSLNPDKRRHPDFMLNLDECLQVLNIVNVTQPR